MQIMLKSMRGGLGPLTVVAFLTVAATTPCEMMTGRVPDSETPAACGLSGIARQHLADALGRFVVGMTFEAVRTESGDPALAKESWGTPPRREVLWIVSGRDRNRLALQNVACDFDESDRLIRCTPADAVQELQEIALAENESLKEGASAEAVLGRLCTPGQRRTLPGDETVLEYSVVRTSARFNPTCPAYLHFREGRLTSKRLVCR